ncbi:hypothetical protein SH580_12310 [Coraliomargarita algicola]|uniref:YcxB-like protein domain-containing protein n=2 Tax=Coraliomargaritaceae TaxID=3056371 RepID=A0ABU1AXY5_9BACT|nr:MULTISPECIES: hypothetical protein [unclassified Coraliomargarita]MDQ8208968.1 hypothetical protein [Coraliomargarita sp. SDUM461003]WPJ94217.1 hypothetical protein SH580_12310 [Coraliomargarita sp. J2-16]
MIYDPDLRVIRTKKHSEMILGTVFVTLFIAVAIFWVYIPFPKLAVYCSPLIVLPILVSLTKKKTKIILGQEGDQNIFYGDYKQTIRLPTEGLFSCHVTLSHGDSYLAEIAHQYGTKRTTLFHCDDTPTEAEFEEMFKHFGAGTKWTFEKH